MANDGQPFDPPGELLAAARLATASWVRRSIERAAARGGVDPTSLGPDELDGVATSTADRIVAELADLLAQDVDHQRTNPLSIYRGALGEVTGLLQRHRVPTPTSDRFAADRFPGDPYQLGPATWSDIDDDLHVPGLVWGAWKAKVVLDRRREEGKR